MRYAILSFIVMLNVALSASDLSWGWASQSLSGGSNVNAQAIDAKDNVYVTGKFIGPMTVNLTTHNTDGDEDVYVAKYDSQGKILWAATGGGDLKDEGMSVAVSAKGNIYVAGLLSGTAKFGTIEVTAVDAGSQDLFLAKISSNGVWQWVKTWGGTGEDEASHIAVDSKENIYMAGAYLSQISFGKTELSSEYEVPAFFLTKFDKTGEPVWAKSFAKASDGYINQLVLNHKEQPAISGNFGGDLIIDNEIILVQGEDWDGFVCQLDNAGTALWAKALRGPATDSVNGMVSDKQGNLYIIGNFVDSCELDKEVVSIGEADIFVAKLNASGNWVWSNTCGGIGGDYGQCIALSKDGNVLIGAQYNYSATIGETNLEGANGDEPFVAELYDDGAWINAIGASGTLDEAVQHMSLDKNDDIVVSGKFSTYLYLGDNVLNADPEDMGYAEEYFISKIIRN